MSELPGKPIVGVIMGSESDWPTMQHTAKIFDEFGVPYEARVVSAHRTPDVMRDYATTARDRGLRMIIAGAGGAAHLPGMVAAWTSLPVLGVPIQSRALSGLDSLLSIVQMPGGVPTATFAIGESGARNAAYFAIRMLASDNSELRKRYDAFVEQQASAAIASELTPHA